MFIFVLLIEGLNAGLLHIIKYFVVLLLLLK